MSTKSNGSDWSNRSNGTNAADIIIPKFKEEYKKQLAKVENELKTQIEDAKLSIKENEEERKKLMEKWAQFTNRGTDVRYELYENLYYNDGGKCLAPDEVLTNFDIRNKWLTKKGYSTNEYTNPNSYYEGIKKFEEHINGEYAPWYNKCFEDYVGIDYDEFLTQISEIDTAIAECEATIYSNRQQIKLIPYEYKKIFD